MAGFAGKPVSERVRFWQSYAAPGAPALPAEIKEAAATANEDAVASAGSASLQSVATAYADGAPECEDTTGLAEWADQVEKVRLNLARAETELQHILRDEVESVLRDVRLLESKRENLEREVAAAERLWDSSAALRHEELEFAREISKYVVDMTSLQEQLADAAKERTALATHIESLMASHEPALSQPEEDKPSSPGDSGSRGADVSTTVASEDTDIQAPELMDSQQQPALPVRRRIIDARPATKVSPAPASRKASRQRGGKQPSTSPSASPASAASGAESSKRRGAGSPGSPLSAFRSLADIRVQARKQRSSPQRQSPAAGTGTGRSLSPSPAATSVATLTPQPADKHSPIALARRGSAASPSSATKAAAAVSPAPRSSQLVWR
eukprot:TRINITY_DN80071_c0_g1_i1.p1 TRINITY_DN80071_c0_g1~~TRINITY_DN80071_c0_g1_i1.p1  ORF type:complete len:385 (-),score=80.00 TRINITY_DN80071_c0_g1_i1:232-1386(-)